MSEKLKQLFDAACEARERSYSPYSGYKVGAALRTSDGAIYSGCNVENSSYGGTCCAERVAIQSAIAAQGKIRIAEMVIVTDSTPPWPPCGLCRQVIAEFTDDTTILIHAANLAGDFESTSFAELFPRAFTPAHLARPHETS